VKEFNRATEAGKESYTKAETKAKSESDVAISLYEDAKNEFEKAAGALAAPFNAEAELSNVRTVAKEWLAAALALFGLLSFSARFLGGDALDAFGTSWAPMVFLALTVGAVLFAVLCNFFGTRAAHG
jgi:hypothetical protein